ncbi:hypothetical protein CH379_011395 [Leptospira ellisii]|uniref:Uncharacterized protein n=1 Tax=Leptospira ellisii TaxID=2023197 RepID=A0A2N0BP03_9LEPT|nr:hypothetical protein [Leptospira ellisii]MDV6236228.1 hypothetical protein [Leptospira ellisii]PJZ93817.1 hypothetical protein CH379_05905 [Leptospira ellisii]PKA05688.1 hypothetical protein CH375_03820 [Leptospira ellisii]
MNNDLEKCIDCLERDALKHTDLCAECIRKKFHEMIPYFEKIRPRDAESTSAAPKPQDAA